MKRAAICVGGFAYGLFLTWICLYIFSHIDWPSPDRPAIGCHEIDKCPMSWWTLPLLFTHLLGAPVLFGILNAVEWQRWSNKKWTWGFGGLTVLTVAHRLAGYAI